jgi:glycosyltransferase involved in cell wall biosynthesis
MPNYTFLLPAYKAKYLTRMLQSIQSQSCKYFKVIVSDDCSPEDIKSIVDPFLEDKRFAYIRQEKNIGKTDLVKHWNMLLEMCNTEFVILASDDDVYAPTFLESIDKLIGIYPSCNIFRSRVERIDADDRTLIREDLYTEFVDQLHFIHQNYRSDTIPCVSNYCYRTSVLKEMGGFVNYPLAWFSDDATNILMAKNGCVNTEEILFGFRWSDINITFSKPTRHQSYQKIDATILYDKWLKELLASIDEEQYLSERYLIDRIRYLHQQKLSGMIAPYTNMCSIGQFFKYVKVFRKECGYDIKPILFLYLKHLVKNKD